MRYAIINTDNIVRNVVDWNGSDEWSPPPDTTLVELGDRTCGPGWIYDGHNFTPPPDPE